jgi:flagellar hook assembly protein FlgD
MAGAAFVKLVVYDRSGREIKTLLNDEQMSGVKLVTWDGRNAKGEKIASGVYLLVLKVGETVQTRKVVVVK